MKKSVIDFIASDEALVCLTAYTVAMAQAADPHCDLLLVGDSVSMVLYGEDSTQQADLEMMIRHGRAVSRAAKRAIVIVDMPFGTYEHAPEDALENAQRIMRETGCDGVKLEGGAARAETIRLLVQNDIPVMGHIGLLPQSVATPDGFRVQGRELEAAQTLMNDAKAVEEAGAFAVVIEAVPEPLAAAITGQAGIPTIGIGASPACDGQILVSEDMLGMGTGRPPKFVRQYTQLQALMDHAIGQYAQDVRIRAFPAADHVYAAKVTQKVKKAS
jgi:3-methyl-2-oxobutanoate hydroxymethyltransferase